MPAIWERVVRAVSCRVEFEFACGRGKLVDEAGVKLYTVEALQAISGREVDVEINHSDLPGNKRIDLVIKRPQSSIFDATVELKWIRASGNSSRAWAEEVGEDILRLERLDDDCDSNTERIIFVVGTHDEIKRGLKNRTKNRSGQSRLRIFNNFLQGKQQNLLPPNPSVIKVRDCDAALRPFFKTCATGFLSTVPISYRINLIAQHDAGNGGESIEAYAWQVRRVTNRRTFNAATRSGW